MTVFATRNANVHWISAVLATLTASGAAMSGEVPSLASPRDSATVLGSWVKLAPNAKVGRMTRVAIPLAGTATTQAYQFTLEKGAIEVQVPQRTDDDFDVRVVQGRLVELPNDGPPAAVLVRSAQGQVAVVVGGKASFRVDDGHLTAINRDGKTLVGTAKSVRPLDEGYAKSYGCSAGEAARVVPPNPLLLPGKRLWIATGSDAIQPESIRWISSEGAHHYTVRVADSRSGAAIATYDTTETSLGEHAPKLYPGQYDVTVEPIDACGIVGKKSAPTSLRVVGVAMPLGGYVDEQGTVRTVVGKSLLFTHAEGLFMSFSESGAWAPVPASLRMFHERGMNLRFRTDPFHPVSLRVAPRDVRASVKMTPRGARWPEQSIEVTVNLSTAAGPAPEWLEPHVRLTLGLKPIYVPWKREGKNLRATIPPQPASCPCVIRAEVTDQYGIALGRSFLEVSDGSS